MFTNNINENSTNNKANRNIIRISDYYAHNCSEQEYAEVDDTILQAYAEFDRLDERYRDRYRTHVNRFVNSEKALEQQQDAEVFNEDYHLDRIIFEKLAAKCGQVTYRRARLHFIYGISLTTIAKNENVSVMAVKKSIDKATKILAEMYNIRLK